MKKFLRKRFLGIPFFAILAVVLAATVVLAGVWITTNLTSTGKITVESPGGPPPLTYTYTVKNNETQSLTTVLEFGDTTVASGGNILVISAELEIFNTGTATITSIDCVVSNLPAGLTYLFDDNSPVLVGPGQCQVVNVRLMGTAPVGPVVIDLSGITATLTPN